jgi:hypothetical protein
MFHDEGEPTARTEARRRLKEAERTLPELRYGALAARSVEESLTAAQRQARNQAEPRTVARSVEEALGVQGRLGSTAEADASLRSHVASAANASEAATTDALGKLEPYLTSNDPAVARGAAQLRDRLIDLEDKEQNARRRVLEAADRYTGPREALAGKLRSLDPRQVAAEAARYGSSPDLDAAMRMAAETDGAYRDVEKNMRAMADAAERATAARVEALDSFLRAFEHAPATHAVASTPPRSEAEYVGALAATGLTERLVERPVSSGGVGMRPGERLTGAVGWGGGVYSPETLGPDGADAASWARRQLAAAEVTAPGVSLHTALHDDGPAAVAALAMVATRADLEQVGANARSKKVREAAAQRAQALQEGQAANAELAELCRTLSDVPALLTSPWHTSRLVAAAATAAAAQPARAGSKAEGGLLAPSGLADSAPAARERLLLRLMQAASGGLSSEPGGRRSSPKAGIASVHDPGKLALEIMGLAGAVHEGAGFREFVAARSSVSGGS